jgi:polyisoprenyl-phosphate glycosyltransferase
MKFSIIIPCYNEGSNLPILIENITPLLNDYELEYVLVENGSTDNSRKYFKNNIEGKYQNIKIEYVDKNKGYGFGIQQGLKLSEGKYVGWIHADMQFPPNDLKRFFDFILSNDFNEKFFLKGKRLNRSLLERFFTAGQSVFSSIIFLYKMHDIGAAPVVFSKSLIDNFDSMPDDFSIEIFTYLTAKRKNFQIERFQITIKDRKNSSSSWNNGLMSMIKLSFQIIKSSILIKMGMIKK